MIQTSEKRCTKCGKIYPATTEYFHRHKGHFDGLRSECKICALQQKQEYYQHGGRQKRQIYHQANKDSHNQISREYYKTFIGRLRRMIGSIKHRCTNFNYAQFKNYGGRGIKLEFTFDELYNWCIENKVDPRGLQIDRIDNDGNYNLSNIRFVTAKENVI